jgi:hypothetical protein
MTAFILKVKALFVVGSSNEVIEQLSRELALLVERRGGKVVEPDPSAITFYLRWCINLVGDEYSIEKEKQRIADKYPGVSFILEESNLTE